MYYANCNCFRYATTEVDLTDDFAKRMEAHLKKCESVISITTNDSTIGFWVNEKAFVKQEKTLCVINTVYPVRIIEASKPT